MLGTSAISPLSTARGVALAGSTVVAASASAARKERMCVLFGMPIVWHRAGQKSRGRGQFPHWHMARGSSTGVLQGTPLVAGQAVPGIGHALVVGYATSDAISVKGELHPLAVEGDLVAGVELGVQRGLVDEAGTGRGVGDLFFHAFSMAPQRASCQGPCATLPTGLWAPGAVVQMYCLGLRHRGGRARRCR